MSGTVPTTNPLSYTGIDPKKQPKFFIDQRAPTTNDFLSFEIGDQWLDKSSFPPTLYILVSVSNNIGTWKLLGTASSAGIYSINGISPDGGGNFGITAGSNVTITPGVNSISIASSGGSAGLSWEEVTGVTQSIEINMGYILNNATLVTATLPLEASVGSVIRLVGKGSGGWLLAQNAGQIVHFGDVDTTLGATGSIASTETRDAIEILCTTANTDFTVLSSQGAILLI